MHDWKGNRWIRRAGIAASALFFFSLFTVFVQKPLWAEEESSLSLWSYVETDKETVKEEQKAEASSKADEVLSTGSSWTYLEAEPEHQAENQEVPSEEEGAENGTDSEPDTNTEKEPAITSSWSLVEPERKEEAPDMPDTDMENDEIKALAGEIPVVSKETETEPESWETEKNEKEGKTEEEGKEELFTRPDYLPALSQAEEAAALAELALEEEVARAETALEESPEVSTDPEEEPSSVAPDTASEEPEDVETEKDESNALSFPLFYSSEDNGIKMTITREVFDTSICYTAHILTDGRNPFRTEYAFGTWHNCSGAGFTGGEKGSAAAARLGCTFLVNGDFRDTTFAGQFGIIRNGEIISNIRMAANAIGLTKDGDFCKVDRVYPAELLEGGIEDTFVFGPLLVNNGLITNAGNYNRWDTVQQNPRTLIGQVYHDDDTESSLYGKKEYYVVVIDGRQPGYSNGMTLYECAYLMQSLGCDFAYNLDGGGSSVMVFQEQVVNNPSGGTERNDCDFLYIP